ncbi:MAG: LysR family transcriptional regulator [Merdibacter sp.]
MKAHLDHYRIFCIAASERSFSRAAGQLYISQSAVSQCISQLESDLQTQLFVRSRRGVYLTKAGELLYQKVKNALSMIEQGERQLDQLLRFEEGSLHIAAGATMAAATCPTWVCIQYPKIASRWPTRTPLT